MNTRVFFSASLVVLGLGGLACGSARDVGETGGQVLSQCTSCHGGEDNLTGAPPRDVSGRSDASLASIGAHTAHVEAGAIARAFDCDACHVKPAAVAAPGHADGTVQITFGAISTASGTVSPQYTRATTGCATVYCHGAFPMGNASNVPVWTAGASQAACGSCHGDPAATPSALPRRHVQLAPGSTNATCNVCHPETVKADGTVDAAGGKHVDGLSQTDPAAIHPFGWLSPTSPLFHMNASPDATCLRCHALNAPARVTKVVCNNCHVAIGHPLTLSP